MVPLNSSVPYDEKRVLVADDEREHIDFLIDYLKAKGFAVTFVENAEEAFTEANKLKFRAYFIDLNIPVGPTLQLPKDNETYLQYVGLHIIRAIRSQGNSGARVLAYSAHLNEKITAEIEHLYCKYIVKGRARELKLAFDAVLAADPQAQRKA